MQRMNKLKIAVLDNGVDEKLLALCGLPDIIQQNKGNISDEEDLFMHGTNCAMIIGLNCADAELYSYKLLDNTGKGNVDDLKSAFDWCLMNNIRLVNLSFGTTHFKDKGIMIIPELSEPPVRTLGATIPENESHIFR